MEFLYSYVKRFLNHMLADATMVFLQAILDKLFGATEFFRMAFVKQINDDIGIQQTVSVHSFLPV